MGKSGENIKRTRKRGKMKQKTASIKNFDFEGKNQPVTFIETMHITDGVDCDVYIFDDDKFKDLGIIKIKPGYKTPLQKVLKGDSTIEGYISGKGKLTVTRMNGEKKVYEVGDATEKPFSVKVRVSELMQWEASGDSDLTAYEICFPPYEDGRYENIK